MRRREFLLLVTATAMSPQVARAQRNSSRIPRVGVLWHATNEDEEAV